MRTALPYAAALALLMPAAGWSQQAQTQDTLPDISPRMEQEQERTLELETRPPQELAAPPATRHAQATPQPTQQTGQVQQQQDQTEIQVQQGQPEITVRQPEPEVQVEQARPEVELQQEEAQIDVRTGQPQVQVQPPQQQPQAEIQRAQPNVQIQQAQPEVTIDQQEPEVVFEQAQEQPKITIERLSRDEARLRDAGIERNEDLIGMAVVDQEDSEVGEVSDLLMEENRIQSAVVTRSGGIFSGDRQVAIPWQEVEVDQKNQRLRVRMSDDQIGEMPEFQYDEETAHQALVGPEQQDQGQAQQQPQQEQQQ